MLPMLADGGSATSSIVKTLRTYVMHARAPDIIRSFSILAGDRLRLWEAHSHTMKHARRALGSGLECGRSLVDRHSSSHGRDGAAFSYKDVRGRKHGAGGLGTYGGNLVPKRDQAGPVKMSSLAVKNFASSMPD